jgi:glucuronoarabinoxylan endo-1,4-beta-xylanase
MHPGQIKEDELIFEDNSPYALLLSAATNDSVVGSVPSTYHNYLTENKTEHLWHTMSTTGHDHSSVKPHLYNFFRIIFKTDTNSNADKRRIISC